MSSSRRTVLFLLSLACLLAASGPLVAQSANPQDHTFAYSGDGSMPAWVVPVLKLVSSTHVEPTTGIVLSESGLVIVPADFAEPGDEIIVLDGGTDILRNGRPAKLQRSFPASGLELLRVDGLSRPAAPFAKAGLPNGARVQLTAFPPAEMIAQGKPPVKTPTTLTVLSGSGQAAVTAESPLPNVTGALLDSCGNLAGISIAADIQSIEPSPGTRYQWRDSLLRLLDEMNLEPGESACSATTDPEKLAEPAPEPPPAPSELEIDPPSPAESSKEKPEPDTGDASAGEDSPDEETLPEDSIPMLEILPPIELNDPDEPEQPPADSGSSQESTPGWLWMLAAALLIVAGLVLHWLRTRPADVPADPAVPATPGIEMQPEANADTDWSPPPLDSRLTLRGLLGDGSPFEAGCDVASGAINLVLGRGHADLVIDSAAVSRQHARLNGTCGLLTLADLGSNNGTAINGVPCLEGEILYVEPGDTISLGDVRFTLEIAPTGGD